MSYYSDAELAANRRAQDAALSERHRQFDLQAQDHSPKHFRFRFAVVGEGTRTAQDNFRRGYERISWKE